MESTFKEIRDGQSVLDLDPKSTVGGGVEDVYGEDRATEDKLVTPWTFSVASGYSLLRDPQYNKGLAFTEKERDAHYLCGLLPPIILSQKLQEKKLMQNIRQYQVPLQKYMSLMELQERNERLFYKLLIDNVEELLPIVYTPTVGEACQKYGSIFERPQGLYISLKEKGKILEVLKNWPERTIQAIVVTDGERILGLGDLGCQGMGIPVGKLSLYTALGGVRPSACLPITIDVGTNNEQLLKDEFYIGLRQRRATGKEYYELLHEFMSAVKQNYGEKVLIQFEDFANHNAFELLAEYRTTHLVFIFEKTKKKKCDKDKENDGDDSNAVLKDQEKLRKRVTTLIKKQKLVAARQIVKGQDDSKPWGQDAKAKVGSRLIELLMQTAYIQPPANQLADGPPDIRPAFLHSLKTVMKEGKKISRRFGIIECDPLVIKGLERTARHMVIPYMPMLVPPVKWTGYDKGGHLFLPSYVMRIRGARQQREAVKRAPRKQLEPVFEALDTLGNTKWRVNKRVLSVVDRIWASGGRLADLVDRNDIPLPDQPDTEDEAQLKKWRWKVKSVKKENRERHSQRCDIELKLAVARKMKDEEGFFYPHNLDFRGRAYPMHPYLNHLGSDLCRGILEFAEGRPLGKSGLRWLKIHFANLFAGGVDKLSHEGRLTFTENHLDDIFDSADRPLEGKRWWLNAEDPFQCLAVCTDLTEALRSSSPETFISHIPIHQDGSCNGLQHYAALGRDKLGAAAVNLVAGEKPADVYSGIAARVLEIMREDAQKDPTIFPDALHARTLINQVDRKLVKQTVMTSVYGVTYIGARDQIKRRLKERSVIADDVELFGASCYAAKITLTALGQMFEAARSIMSWLGECAKIIASENQPVRWTTPLGLPVVQPYRKLGRHLIKTSLQVLTLQRETEKVMVKRQRTAFPPNFVHSLDGSHMMMTANSCKKAGLNFAGVHDSYWTHACDVDELSRILREKFVELYETPILENLLESFQRSFPTLSFPPLPERGDFDLRDVLESPYFFN